MLNATPVLPFKTPRPTRRHYFLRVNFRPFSFFTRTTLAKINLLISLVQQIYVAEKSTTVSEETRETSE